MTRSAKAARSAILIAIAALALAGCNTVAGMGDDISGGARMVLRIPGAPPPPPAEPAEVTA